jgi:hypothetical protein
MLPQMGVIRGNSSALLLLVNNWPIALYQRVSIKGEGRKGQGNGAKGKGSIRKGQKAPRLAHHLEFTASLLISPRRQKLLEHIWQRTSVSRTQFAALHLAPLERYAEMVQQFPASEAHHHAYPGSIYEHAGILGK